MQLFTNEVKLIPESEAASLAESLKVRGIRIVTDTSSESRKYERISVGEAPELTKSE